jgi:hypothetical protein
MSGRPSPPEKRIPIQAKPRPIPRRRRVRRRVQANNTNNQYSSNYGRQKRKQSRAQQKKEKASRRRVAQRIRLLETPAKMKKELEFQQIDALYLENTGFEDSVISVIEKAIKNLRSEKQATDEKKIEIGQTFWDGIDKLKEQQVVLQEECDNTESQKLKEKLSEWVKYYKEIETWLVAQGEALHLIRFTEPLTTEPVADHALECSICWDDFEMNETGGYLNISKLAKLDCHHVFHKNCLYGWYKEYEKRTKKMSCPNCRTEIENIINGIVHLRF